MKYKKEKIFWVARGPSKEVIFESWDEEEEYYSFVKRNLASGYHQLSVPSEIMLKIISSFLESGTWGIDKIEMMEDDSELNASLETIISSIDTNPGKIISLFEYLNTITEDSSIEVKRIYLSGRDEHGTLRRVFIQVNGIIGVYNAVNEIHTKLSAIMREYI